MRMAREGMDIARLNFSHGDLEVHRAAFEAVRDGSSRIGKFIGVLQDLPGPKIRVGHFKKGVATLDLRDGEEFHLATFPFEGEKNQASVDFPRMEKFLQPGDRIFLDDGKIELKVSSTEQGWIHSKVVIGGQLAERKGVNVSRVLPLPVITEHDVKALKQGIELGVDYVAVSFAREPKNIIEVKKILKKKGSGHVLVIAKIEDKQGIDNLSSILEVSDGIMIARGDMGVSLDRADVPLIQKRIIKQCNRAGKPVIVATQMLDTMRSAKHPTRAEVSDIANAVLEGADVLMLSDETAVGSYPVEATREIVRIINRIESSPEFVETLRSKEFYPAKPDVYRALGPAIDQLSQVAGGEAIVCLTKSGKTAQMLSKFRPLLPIIAVTPTERVARSLVPFWGVEAIVGGEEKWSMENFRPLLKLVVEKGLVRPKSLVILTSGVTRKPVSATIRLVEV